MINTFRFMAILLASAFVFSGCGGSKNSGQEDSSQSKQEERPDMSSSDNQDQSTEDETTEENSSPNNADQKVADLTDKSGKASVTVKTPGENMQDMKYDIDLIKVNKGQEIELTLNNVAPESASAMQHNFVVVEPDNARDVAQAGMKNQENDYLPDDESNVIASTKVLKPGEKTTITFTIDETGTYEFICTYPGHYPTMKGKLKVEESSAS